MCLMKNEFVVHFDLSFCVVNILDDFFRYFNILTVRRWYYWSCKIFLVLKFKTSTYLLKFVHTSTIGQIQPYLTSDILSHHHCKIATLLP